VDPGLLTYLAGTVVLWGLSGALAIVVAAVLAAGALGQSRTGRLAASVLTTVTRGVPTSLLVVAGGVAAAGVAAPDWLPNVFPGTPDGLEVVAWSIVVALALGSAGHLAVIFATACRTLSTGHRDQLAVLALSGPARLALMAREAAAAGLAPTGARLVHHLHNTAFAALFPVADLFGWIQLQANGSFEVSRYVSIGAAVYVVLSAVIWVGFRTLEAGVGGRRPDRSPVRVAAGDSVLEAVAP
jgi:ABC-type arginine/histidine transport system permease subunit